LIFRAVFGLLIATIVIGFYLTMFAEAVRGEFGFGRGLAIAFFLVFPISSAFIYFGWTRYIRKRGTRD